MIHYISYTYNKSENNNENAYSKLYDTVKPYKKDFNSILSEYKNKQIVITGMGFSDIISNFISEALFLKGYSCAHTLHLQLLSPENKDNLLIIAISRSGKTSRLVELVEEANNHGFKIISFTANKNSKLAESLYLICSNSKVMIALKVFQKNSTHFSVNYFLFSNILRISYTINLICLHYLKLL